MGRWDYGPWFWPPLTTVANGGNLVHGDVRARRPTSPHQVCPGTPNLSVTPEAFMDTPVVNGTAYPYLHVRAQGLPVPDPERLQ